MLRLQNERMNGALLPSAQEFFKVLRDSPGETRRREAGRDRDASRADESPVSRSIPSVADGNQSVILPQVEPSGIAGARWAGVSILAGNA